MKKKYINDKTNKKVRHTSHQQMKKELTKFKKSLIELSDLTGDDKEEFQDLSDKSFFQYYCLDSQYDCLAYKQRDTSFLCFDLDNKESTERAYSLYLKNK